MKINYEQAVAFFVLGAFSVYVIARISAPTIKQKIAENVAREVVAKQREAGVILINEGESIVQIGNPIASSVLRAMYLE